LIVELSEINVLHKKFLRPGFGTTTPDELLFIQQVIQTYKPKKILEIGTASGLTTGFIARFLDQIGGGHVTSVDISSRFFGDPSQNVGYLTREIYTGTEVGITIETGRSSLDLEDLGGPWDLAFIDASHNHPWPTIDTLAVAAHLNGPRIVLHHDLQLFRRFKAFQGIGPRVLFNETPERHRHASSANRWNIFYMDLTMPQDLLEEVALNALSMPWTVQPALRRGDVAKIFQVLGQTYSAGFMKEFEECEKQNRWSKFARAMFHLRVRKAKIVKMLNGGPA